ncbi:MAG: hypothetical protein ACP5OG_06250 [Candidatus Nanoarchaeia archaeon]
MTNIFDFNEIHQDRLLEELAEQLETTLKCIAYAGKSKDKKYLLESKEYYKKVTKNGRLFEIVGSDINSDRVASAYFKMMNLGEHPYQKYNTPEYIARDAKDIIWDELYTEPQETSELKEYEDMIFGED